MTSSVNETLSAEVAQVLAAWIPLVILMITVATALGGVFSLAQVGGGAADVAERALARIHEVLGEGRRGGSGTPLPPALTGGAAVLVALALFGLLAWRGAITL